LSRLLELTGPNHEAMIKEALVKRALGPISLVTGAGKLLGNVAGKAARNPLKTFGTLAVGSDMMSTAGRMRSIAEPGMDTVTNLGRRTM